MSKTEYFGKMLMFKYSSEIVLFLAAFIYSFFAANFLGPEKYGLVSYLAAFMASLPLIFGFAAVFDTSNIYSAKGFSQKIIKKLILYSGIFLAYLAIVVAVFADKIALFLGKGTPDLILISSAIIFFVPITMIFNSVFSGRKLFGKILKLTILEKVLDVVLLIFFLFVLKTDLFSVLYVKIIVSLILISVYIYYFRKFKDEPKHYNKKEISTFFKTSIFANLFAGFSKQSQMWVLIAFLAPQLLGLMYLLQRFENYFFNLPTSALREVAQPFLSEQSHKKKALLLYTNIIFRFQVLTNVLFIIIFLLIVPTIISIFFSEYSGLILIVPLAVISFFFVFPFGGLVKSINRNDIILWGAIISIFVVFLIGIPLIIFYGLVGAVLLFFTLKVTNFIFLYLALWKVGYKISFLPRKKDIKLFYGVAKKLIFNILKKG
jgi:O-antigen/teichoic acid export membrane protein